MKKIRQIIIGMLLIGIPFLIYSWCCLPPSKHCEYRYTFDATGNLVFVDEQGVPAPKDANGMCGKCHHEVELHTCNEDGWPE